MLKAIGSLFDIVCLLMTHCTHFGAVPVAMKFATGGTRPTFILAEDTPFSLVCSKTGCREFFSTVSTRDFFDGVNPLNVNVTRAKMMRILGYKWSKRRSLEVVV